MCFQIIVEAVRPPPLNLTSLFLFRASQGLEHGKTKGTYWILYYSRVPVTLLYRIPINSKIQCTDWTLNSLVGASQQRSERLCVMDVWVWPKLQLLLLPTTPRIISCIYFTLWYFPLQYFPLPTIFPITNEASYHIMYTFPIIKLPTTPKTILRPDWFEYIPWRI